MCAFVRCVCVHMYVHMCVYVRADACMHMCVHARFLLSFLFKLCMGQYYSG